MSFLKSLNRYIERNQAASKALVGQFDQLSITEIDDFNASLWASINTSPDKQYILKILNHDDAPLEFVVKLLIKIGFSNEDSVRLMMKLHHQGFSILACADQNMLIELQTYINTQAEVHRVCLPCKITKANTDS